MNPIRTEFMLRFLCLAPALFTPLVLPGHVADATTSPETLADDWTLDGIVVNEPGWDLWGASPVMDEQGRVHLFIARWPGEIPFDSAWRTRSEIAHYVGEGPHGPFEYVETVLHGDGEGWDAQGYHNPNIQQLVDGRFALTCIANSGVGRHGPNQRIEVGS